MVEILPLAELAPQQVEAILDAAFGPGRLERTAYRLRAGMPELSALSFALFDHGKPQATVQSWPVAHAGDDGFVTPLVMVGPVAVLPECQRRGFGRRLMEKVMVAAPEQADGVLMMIGDPEYYGRFFGFSAADTGAWRLPGPFERHRLLAAPVGAHAVPTLAGEIGPRPAGVLAS